jgi:hypothetical protein
MRLLLVLARRGQTMNEIAYKWGVIRRLGARRQAERKARPGVEAMHARPKPDGRIKEDAIVVGLKKLESGCDDCGRGYLRLAVEHGATEEELIQAVDKSYVAEKTGIDRRTLLKFIGVTGGALVAETLFPQPAGATPVHYWGVDSVARINEKRTTGACDGTKTLADLVTQKLGTPNWWGRYFAPSVQPTIATGEAAELKRNGINHLLVITAPGESREETGGTTGHDYGDADGKAVCNAVKNYIGDNTGTPQWPKTDGLVTIWLDIELANQITQSYWNGWRDAVRNYNNVTSNPFRSDPFLPGAYMNPTSTSTCNVLDSTAHPTHGIWTNQPQDSPSTCPPLKPAWNAQKCNQLLPYYWQHATNPGNWDRSCNLWFCNNTNYGVDLDGLNPNYEGELNHNIYIPLT